MAKEKLTCLFRERPETPEGKYCVLRRDGTVPPWPSFVLGGADPIAQVALEAYAGEVARLLIEQPEAAESLGLTWEFCDSLRRWVREFAMYRDDHGQGDPGMGPHRTDDPATVAKMREGRSA